MTSTNRVCKYPKCHYYKPGTKTYCCDACSSDHYDYDRLHRGVMHLKEGRIYTKEWDGKIIPALANGPLRERKDLTPKGFLVVHQIFDSVIEEDGKLFSCSAWSPPSGESYVEVKKYEANHS